MSAADMTATKLTRRFAELGIEDVSIVGGKNASLGEMVRELMHVGISVPDGFATTAFAYEQYLRSTGLDQVIRQHLEGLNVHDVADLQQRGNAVRQAILQTPLPTDLCQEIERSYLQLTGDEDQPVAVAVRSSATAEDLPDASFAGQQETFLNIQGIQPLLKACHECYASLFTDRAIAYREHQGFDHSDVALSIGVQRMVRADVGAAGVMFTVDTETGFDQVVLINAAYGLGENVVKGIVNPDEYVVFKPLLNQDHRPIVKKEIGTKEYRMICSTDPSDPTTNTTVPLAERNEFALCDDDILQLARWAVEIEKHYSQKNGRPTPMDIEWGRDGLTGQLYILQARPETVHSSAHTQQLEQYVLDGKGKRLTRGCAVGQRIGAGRVCLVESPSALAQFQPGDVLVAQKTDPDWEPVMKKASAIVTEHGGRTCHAAIVARELGVPAIVGTNDAMQVLQTGQPVTICCAEGEVGSVYDGQLPFHVDTIDLGQMPETRTRLMVNVAEPGSAFSLASLPVDGVGLARMEFTVSNLIQAHPLALLNYDKLDPVIQQQIDSVSTGYSDKCEFFVERLSQGIGTIAAAFYPHDVIVRMSDFKTNEYANLIGGAPYEPDEENPMLGFRGASRYYDSRYRDGFELECRAMHRARTVMGLNNIKLMIPFCRTVAEGRKVVAEMERHGLVRGKDGLEIYVMCELPSNVLLAEQFAEVFDGFSIGSNDLTQLTLGVDRDSELVAHLFDERNDAVKQFIGKAVRDAHRCQSRVGICGQAPSDYPEFTEFLVELGIDSISVTPDVALKTRLLIADAESKLAND